MPSLRIAHAILISALTLAACTSAAPPPADDRPAPAQEGGDPASPAVVVDVVKGPEPAPAPVRPICEVQVADAPTALFSERLLIRPPIGVEVFELTPMFARSPAAMRSACDGVVTQVAIGLLADDPDKPLTVVRDEIIAAMGLAPAELRREDVDHPASRLAGATSLPNPAGGPPSRGWFTLVRSSGLLGWALIESSAEDYAALAPTIAASGASLLIVPSG